MGRPPLAVGTYGKIRIYPNDEGYRARAYFRDHDGARREVEAWARTKAQAERRLKVALTDRSKAGAAGDVTPDMRLRILAERWLDDIDAADRASATKRLYRFAAEKYLIPALGSLRLREVDVPAADRALRAIRASHGAGAAKTARSVLSGMLATAVRQGAMPSNPVRDTSPISTKAKTVRALTVTEANELLDLLRSDPRGVDLDLPDLVDWMLGTGMRIGEACAMRQDVLDVGAGTAEVNATVVRDTGKGLSIQERPKSAAGWRVLALPAHLVEMLARRRTEQRLTGPQGVVFCSPRGKLRDPSNTSNDLRQVLDSLQREKGDEPGPWAWVTSHVFRKTVATRLDEAGMSPREIADILGHAKPSMTMDVYMGRKVVSASMATILGRDS